MSEPTGCLPRIARIWLAVGVPHVTHERRGTVASWPSGAVRNDVGLVADDRVAVRDCRVYDQFSFAMGASARGASPQELPIAFRELHALAAIPLSDPLNQSCSGRYPSAPLHGAVCVIPRSVPSVALDQ